MTKLFFLFIQLLIQAFFHFFQFLLVKFDYRNLIGFIKPVTQINIGATFGTKRMIFAPCFNNFMAYRTAGNFYNFSHFISLPGRYRDKSGILRLKHQAETDDGGHVRFQHCRRGSIPRHEPGSDLWPAHAPKPR